jgi:hypothetical protein
MIGRHGCLAFAVFAAITATSAGEWEPLFNGRNLDGWNVECRDPDRGKNYWQVADGVIECNTAGDRKHDYVWLVSEREFGDFELEGLVQTFADAPGNSGIQIRSRFLEHPEKGHWLHGPQIDIHPPGPWRCGMIYDETWETRRWIHPPLPSWSATPDEGPKEWRWIHADGQVKAARLEETHIWRQPTGEWNRLRISARGTRIEVDVNGKPVTRFDGTGILDDEAHRRHRVGLHGHIALQLHARDDLRIRFRDLRIRKLAPDDQPSPVVVVRDDAQLQSALARLGPGSVVRIAPGRYRPGVNVRNAHGTAEHPVVIEGLDPRDPPLFEGGSQAWHFSNVSHLVLRWIRCRGQKHNGINLDDGGSFDSPSHHITLAHLNIEDVGPDGNFDGIKCSGLDHLRIRHCRVAGWGGQAIDFVGCHFAEIVHCVITGKDGYRQHTGPQFKGGSSDVRIHHCRLENAGLRPIQAGGSTGLDYFRPPDAPFEAARITIEDNLIIGGQCAVAFTGVDECDFRHNTILRPDKWIFRILQERTEPRFDRCGNVRFQNNLIVFERAMVRGVANIGSHTRPETFRFRGNHWFATDAPERSKPKLPSAEQDAVHGVDPRLDPKTRRPKAKLPAGQR